MCDHGWTSDDQEGFGLMHLGSNTDINLGRDSKLMSHIEIRGMKRFNLEKARQLRGVFDRINQAVWRIGFWHTALLKSYIKNIRR